VLLPTYTQEAPLDKKTLNGCVSQYLKDFTGDAIRYIGCMTRLFEEYLLRRGSTLSIQDCSVVLPPHIQDTCERTYRVLQCDNVSEQRRIGLLENLRDYVGIHTYDILQTQDSNLLRIVASGAKGNVTHITQNTGMIGQQLNRQSARHEPIHSHHCRPLEDRGFVRSSFVHGLSPIEFFQHLSSARIGLVATAVSTSETGYCYRRISKALEDVRVQNDGTMRDAGNRIVLPYALFDTDRWVFTNRSRLVHTASIDDSYANPPPEERVSLLELRAELLYKKHETYMMMLPVDLCAVAQGLRESTHQCVHTTRTTLYGVVKRACECLLLVPNIPNGTILRHLYMDLLSTVYLGMVHPLALEQELQHCHLRFVKYIRTPYEPIGLIASQSFSEPLTQMQLNLFHHSGERTGMVDGVVRIKEILNLFKTPSVPTMLVVVQAGWEESALPNTLTQLLLSDTLDFWSDILEDWPSDVQALSVVQQQDIYIRLKKDLILSHECCPRHVSETITRFFDDRISVVWYTEDLEQETYGLCVRSKLSLSAMETLVLMTKLERSSVLIKGIRGIMDYYEDSLVTVRTISACGNCYVQAPRKAYRLAGSNFIEVCTIPWVDVVHTSTNDIRSVYTELGIDAVMRCIKNELAAVMCTNSATVQVQHILLMAAIMCISGQPCALTYTGMTNADASTLKLATFERSLDSFIYAGSEGHHDNLNGISESVMIGKCVRTGTGMAEVLTTPVTRTEIVQTTTWGHSSTLKRVSGAELDNILEDILWFPRRSI
jgi:DNA-directed RNA polymerase III subunit RPC1